MVGWTVCNCNNHSEYGCRDAPCEKSWKQGSNTIKDTSVTPPYMSSGKGLRMIVLYSILDSVAIKEDFLVSTTFRMVHPYSHIHSIE